MSEDKKSYYAIIPATVRYDPALPPNAKLLYGEITALCNEKGFCWATNRYFAELYGVTRQTVSVWISLLFQQGYISVDMTRKAGSAAIDQRIIKIPPPSENSAYPIKKNRNTPIKKNPKENITVLNIKENITKSVCVKRKGSAPLKGKEAVQGKSRFTLDEALDYVNRCSRSGISNVESPMNLAMSLYKSGEADSLIEQLLYPERE